MVVLSCVGRVFRSHPHCRGELGLPRRKSVEVPVAEGGMPLENAVPGFARYGYDQAAPLVPAYGDVQSAAHNVEATKTEPDKNTYLVLEHGLPGADPLQDYGQRFLFQGHEL